MNNHSFCLTLHDTAILKGIAICAMLVHHLFYEHPEYGDFVWHGALLGKVCVAIFLFLSGFGMTFQFGKIAIHGKPLIRGGQIVRFLLRRYVKFYLNYWVVFLIFVPIGVFLFDRPLSIPYGENANVPLALFKDFLGLQKFNSYNMTWWFNQIIIVLWLAFPVLYFLVKNRFTTLVLLLVAIVAFPANALAFLLGIYVANYRDELEKIIRRMGDRYFLGCLSLLLLLLCINRECGYVGSIAGLKADPYIAMLLSTVVAISTKKISYSMPVLAYLGKHSMNMYMVHTFVFAYFFHDFIYSFQYPILIFIALLLSSLGVSVVIETLKMQIGFYKLIQVFSSKLSV